MTTTVEHAQNLVADATRRADAHYDAGDMDGWRMANAQCAQATRELRKAEQFVCMQAGAGGYTTYHSDRQPVTVSRTTRTSVWVRADDYKLRSGNAMEGNAKYLFVPQPDAPEKGPFRWSDKRGCFLHKGEMLRLGGRSRYHDPHH